MPKVTKDNSIEIVQLIMHLPQTFKTRLELAAAKTTLERGKRVTRNQLCQEFLEHGLKSIEQS